MGVQICSDASGPILVTTCGKNRRVCGLVMRYGLRLTLLGFDFAFAAGAAKVWKLL